MSMTIPGFPCTFTTSRAVVGKRKRVDDAAEVMDRDYGLNRLAVRDAELLAELMAGTLIVNTGL